MTNINKLADFLAYSCYGFLAINFLFGLYCVILLWRRIIQLRFRSEQEQVQFLDELQVHLRNNDFPNAENLCQTNTRALPQLALVVMSNRGLAYEELRQMVAELLQRDVLADLEYKLSWIATVIKSGPLLGLFGTVLGMMAAFGRIGTGEKVQPSQIAHEISIALICTAMGLATAIPFSFILASLNIRVRNLQESLSSGLTRFLEYFNKHVTSRVGRKR
jgi:biopolymer transport protein ExbB/TolQ